jgi:cytoskeletal protein CcmA (bactofilin family)
MGFFQKKNTFAFPNKPKMAKETTTSPAAVYNLLAAGTTINGNVQSDCDLRLDGKIVGDLTCTGKVILGPAAVITGQVDCINAEVSGMINGDVNAPEQLILRSQATISGNIYTSTLIVEAGSAFNGLCRMVEPGE